MDSREDILAAVSRFWRFDSDGFPVPRRRMSCPVCKGPKVLQRYWRFLPRDAPYESRVTHRCDTSFKCTICSAVWNHGIPISEEQYEKLRGRHRKMIYWRDR